jgi:hypothetical protein
MVAMFNNHVDTKVIQMSIAYNAPTSEHAPIPKVKSSPCLGMENKA